MSRVAALFVRADSHYRDLGADCFDLARDARTFDLSCPVVAHPPCRAWGNLAQFAKPRKDERDLAWWALHVVRHCGGVLEHPRTSRLWREADCGTPGVRDRFGGVLLTLRQSALGHRAPKPTGIYVCGPVPAIPEDAPGARGRVELMGRAERETTPLPMAAWLLAAARGCAR